MKDTYSMIFELNDAFHIIRIVNETEWAHVWCFKISLFLWTIFILFYFFSFI